jgi:hypothetical protein
MINSHICFKAVEFLNSQLVSLYPYWITQTDDSPELIIVKNNLGEDISTYQINFNSGELLHIEENTVVTVFN